MPPEIAPGSLSARSRRHPLPKSLRLGGGSATRSRLPNPIAGAQNPSTLCVPTKAIGGSSRAGATSGASSHCRQARAVAMYLASLAGAGRADSTITRHLAAIGWRHRQDGQAEPSARDTHMLIADALAGIRREQRARPSARKAAVTAADLTRMIAAAEGEGTRSIRDRAIPALGFASALRRSELVGLHLADVELVSEGVKLTIRHSKTDQEGEGQMMAVPSGKVLKPVARLNAWLAVRGGGGAVPADQPARCVYRSANVRSLDCAACPEICWQGRA